MSRLTVFAAVTILAVTGAIWLYGVSHHRFVPGEFWLYALIFLLPAGLVYTSLWILLHREFWRITVGILCMIPSLVLWLGSLVLVANGFKIH